MANPTPVDVAAQKEVAEVARELSGLRYWLKKVADTLPPPRAAHPTADLDGDPDVATELRSTIDCVTTDCLTPAIADLEAAALYRPAGEAQGGEPEGEA
jgi:hypothetical protein